jgi:hypothetical protein
MTGADLFMLVLVIVVTAIIIYLGWFIEIADGKTQLAKKLGKDAFITYQRDNTFTFDVYGPDIDSTLQLDDILVIIQPDGSLSRFRISYAKLVRDGKMIIDCTFIGGEIGR